MDTTVEEGKTAAITSYILIVGVLIAMSMNAESKNRFAAFHIRQALGLSVLFIVLGTVISNFTEPMITYSFWIFMMVLWSYGFITAIKGQMIAIPLLGGVFQKLFKAL
jgi:uncharacterized membrane protein